MVQKEGLVVGRSCLDGTQRKVKGERCDVR